MESTPLFSAEQQRWIVDLVSSIHVDHTTSQNQDEQSKWFKTLLMFEYECGVPFDHGVRARRCPSAGHRVEYTHSASQTRAA